MINVFIFVLVIAFTAWFSYSLFFFTFYWYEAVNNGSWEKLGEKYSINLKLFAVRAVLVSIFNLAKVWFYWPTRYIPQCWQLPEEKPTKIPIVFVHGYLHNRSAWIKYSKWLKRDGFRHQLAVDLKGKFARIETYAEQLSREIDDLIKKCQVDRVDIVAHSMGGLVSRYYVQKLGGSGRVRKLVTLGTPHNGTKVAVFIVGKARSEMLPGSEFLRNIKIKDKESLGGSELTVLYSDADFMVVPTALARVDAKGVRNKCVGLISHIGFIYSRKVYDEVLSILNGS